MSSIYVETFLRKYLTAKIHYTAQKLKFSIKDFFSKCDQIRSLAVFVKTLHHRFLIGFSLRI